MVVFCFAIVPSAATDEDDYVAVVVHVIVVFLLLFALNIQMANIYDNVC